MRIADKLTDLVGHTPLLRLSAYSERVGAATPVVAKLEYFNPAGSVKDRVAVAMVADAEQRGALRPGATIIEPTSGNTGVGLAMVCAVRGYRLVLTMPETMSVERQRLTKAYGAQVVLTPGKEGMAGSIRKAEALRDSTPGAVILGQFTNPANPAAHYATTAQELWDDTCGTIDVFVAGAGTGGTVSGVGRRLKELKPGVEIVAVEPDTSAVLSGQAAGPHKIQGIGAGFVPQTFSREAVDTILPVSGDDAFRAARLLAGTEGVLAGISSGAALHAATLLARREENRGKTIVALLPDTGERYLSTPLWNGEEGA